MWWNGKEKNMLIFQASLKMQSNYSLKQGKLLDHFPEK